VIDDEAGADRRNDAETKRVALGDDEDEIGEGDSEGGLREPVIAQPRQYPG